MTTTGDATACGGTIIVTIIAPVPAYATTSGLIAAADASAPCPAVAEAADHTVGKNEHENAA